MWNAGTSAALAGGKSQDWAELGLRNLTQKPPLGNLTAQTLVPKGVELTQAWFKHGHICVLGLLGKTQ